MGNQQRLIAFTSLHLQRLWETWNIKNEFEKLWNFSYYLGVLTFKLVQGYKHFSRGNKCSNSLLTKIRVGRSDLNLHRFTIGLVDSPQCDCHFREESPSHYFLDCFLYAPERLTLFGLIEHYIPKFKSFTKTHKLDIILKGFEIHNSDFIQLNTTLTLAVQKFILNTKRFC